MGKQPICELLLAHGAGSTADFLSRAFPASVTGVRASTHEDRTGSTRAVAAALVGRITPHTIVGGVSIGAHAAAKAALSSPVGAAGAVFVMPAWIGDPPADSPTARSAALIRQHGADHLLAQLRADPKLATDWVTTELAWAWPNRPTLATELATAATEPAPTRTELAALAIPAVVVALADDPIHPLEVAQAWAAALPNAVLMVVERDAPATNRSVFARAALTGWRRLNVSR